MFNIYSRSVPGEECQGLFQKMVQAHELLISNHGDRQAVMAFDQLLQADCTGKFVQFSKDRRHRSRVSAIITTLHIAYDKTSHWFLGFCKERAEALLKEHRKSSTAKLTFSIHCIA